MMHASAGDPILQERFFEVAVLDEATQAPEPAALVAVAQRVRPAWPLPCEVQF